MTDKKYNFCEDIEIGYASNHKTVISNIAYFADKIVTPHSDAEIELIEVLNTIKPVGVSGRHKMWAITVGIDSSNYEAFYTQQVQLSDAASRAIQDNADNDVIEWFVVHLRDSAGVLVTKTYTPGTVAVVGEAANYSNEPNQEYQVTEISLVCFGVRVVT